MKTIIVCLMAGLGMTASAALTGTPHDFSAKGFGSANPCAFCHAPHNAQDANLAPLWNHTTTKQQFSPYSSASRISIPGDPGPSSKMCLSCHDGSVAVDSFAEVGALRAGTTFVKGERQIGHGGNLTGDHPVAFDYNLLLAQRKKHLASPVSDSAVDPDGILPLYFGRLECASCHSVHDNSYGMFLRVENSAGRLCLSCHLK